MIVLLIAAGVSCALVTAKLRVLGRILATSSRRSKVSMHRWVKDRFAAYRRHEGRGPIIVSALLMPRAA